MLFIRNEVLRGKKVQPCYSENVEMVYFDTSAVAPPPCDFQMKLFVRYRLNLWRCSVPPGLHVSSQVLSDVLPSSSQGLRWCRSAVSSSTFSPLQEMLWWCVWWPDKDLLVWLSTAHDAALSAVEACTGWGSAWREADLCFPRDWNRHG